MDKTRFWQLIEDARREAGPHGDITKPLAEKLSGMEVSGIMRWCAIFAAYQKLSCKSKLWAAAYVINGGCSDDGFDYFRGWLTAQGQDIFLRALANPDSLAEVDVQMDEAFDEDMLAVGYEAYFQKTGMAQRDYKKAYAVSQEYALNDGERQDLMADIHYAPDIDLKWDEGHLQTVVPKLCAKFS